MLQRIIAHLCILKDRGIKWEYKMITVDELVLFFLYFNEIIEKQAIERRILYPLAFKKSWK